MWKIKVSYYDNSKVVITGKDKDISLRLAQKYYSRYVSSRACSATYQQYPKKDHPMIGLGEKIAELEEMEAEVS